MTKFKVTYNEPGVINRTEVIDANNAREAATIFLTFNPTAEIVKVEEVNA